jgi:5-methylcytosine-specific restriction endonuclease McrA
MKSKFNGRLTLVGLCKSKVQRFTDDLQRERQKTNLTPQWMYNRIVKLMMPGNYVSCETCGMAMTFEGITIDHKFPRSKSEEYKGSIHNTENLELICPTCNSMKGQKSLDEFIKYLEERNSETKQLLKQGDKVILAPLFPHPGLGREIFHKKNKKPKQGPRKNPQIIKHV